ncbi:MAG: NAD-dependent epimerase/dehydratase family protein [Erysipelotrichales bacterium]|nr:NAD-dependent epimerase/dehydratase family protein [Erysipelotrichales bacterium]
MSKSCIVTGASGFVGQRLVNKLLENKYKVYAISRKSIEIQNSLLVQINIDCVDISSIRNYIEEDSIDYFYHFAWEGTSGIDRLNFDIQNRNLENACKSIVIASELNVKKFIFAGSIMEYESLKEFNNTGMIGNTLYGFFKLITHKVTKTLAKELQIDYCSICISNIYGPSDTSARFINELIENVKSDKPMTLSSCMQNYDFIFIEDAVSGIILIAEKGKDGEEYYLGTEENRILKDYVICVKNILNEKYFLNFGSSTPSVSLEQDDIEKEKIFRELNFEIKVTFEEGIKKCVNNRGNNS